MATYTQIRNIPEILDLISEVENGNYNMSKLIIFYNDVKVLLGYEGDE